ncbi:MAG: DUF87 domain-containing protein [Candidatus Heimdallarchaeota archaeon]|nr:DUF87 domain-containing protein [Candidatus Heimdallarchaeota archaeon]
MIIISRIGYIIGTKNAEKGLFSCILLSEEESNKISKVQEGSYVYVKAEDEEDIIYVGVVKDVQVINPQVNDEGMQFWKDRLRELDHAYSVLSLTEYKVVTVHLFCSYDQEKREIVPIISWISPGTELKLADETLVDSIILRGEDGLRVGTLAYLQTEPAIKLHPDKIIEDSLAIFGTRGSGKSYAAGIILEEFEKYGTPCLVIDPHGEYWGLNQLVKTNAQGELEILAEQGITVNVVYPGQLRDGLTAEQKYTAIGFPPRCIKEMFERIQECDNLFLTPLQINFSDIGLTQITSLVDFTSTQIETIETIWNRITDNYQNAVFDPIGFFQYGLANDDIGRRTENALRRKIEIINGLNIFKDYGQRIVDKETGEILWPENIHDGSQYDTESLQMGHFGPKQITILDVSNPELSEPARLSFCASILNSVKDMMRKEIFRGLFILAEEAHRFAPIDQRVPTKSILEWFAREGRKNGAGLCLVSQRPSGLDRDIISQCNSKILMRLTEQADLKVAADIIAGDFRHYIDRLPYFQQGFGIFMGSASFLPIVIDFRERETNSKFGETKKVVPDITDREKSVAVYQEEWKEKMKQYS